MNITKEAGYFFYPDGEQTEFTLDLRESLGLRDKKSFKTELHWVGGDYRPVQKVKSKFTLTHIEDYRWKLEFKKPLVSGRVRLGLK